MFKKIDEILYKLRGRLARCRMILKKKHNIKNKRLANEEIPVLQQQIYNYDRLGGKLVKIMEAQDFILKKLEERKQQQQQFQMNMNNSNGMNNNSNNNNNKSGSIQERP